MNTDELAEFATTQGGLEILRALQSLGVFGGAHARPSPANEGPRSILEWNPTSLEGHPVFERPSAYRCKPKRLAPEHPGTLRVCLFGESMAAGFPLAPAYTPALALEELLKKALPAGRAVEVVDLAMPNMGPSEQLRVVEAARQLAPDVCVFLTGNNWYYGLSVEPTASPDARVHYAAHLEEGGLPGLAKAFRRELAARAEVMVRSLIELSNGAGAASVVVVPASNHDWERRAQSPWLGEGKTRLWFQHFEAARAALEAGAFEVVLREAEAMERLDAGSTGTPDRLRVRALLALGQVREARDAATRAIDAANWQNFGWALPQTPSYVADVMRGNAGALGYRCVDLEAVFAAHTGSPFLDFRLFYDHCHLTGEGIQVAMAAVATRVVEAITTNAAAAPAATISVEAAPRPTTLATASGAYQAAHWLSQFYPSFTERDRHARLVEALRAACLLDGHLESTLRDAVRMKTLACSPSLNGAFPAAVRVPGVAAALLSKRLNAAFLSAALAVLRERDVAGTEEAFESVVASYARALADGIDLAHPTFREDFWEATPLAWDDPFERHGSPLYRASWPESRFGFVTDGAHALTAILVARAPAPAEPLHILLNDVPLVTHALERSWKRYTVALPREQLRRGIHRVSLRWPDLTRDEDAAIRDVTSRLRIGAETDVFPVFGEVFSLEVRRA